MFANKPLLYRADFVVRQTVAVDHPHRSLCWNRTDSQPRHCPLVSGSGDNNVTCVHQVRCLGEVCPLSAQCK